MDKLTIEEVCERVDAMANALDMVVGRIKAETVGFDLADEEVTAIITGEICALVSVRDLFLGALDDDCPHAVLEARKSTPEQVASWIIATGAQGYYKNYVAEGGDE